MPALPYRIRSNQFASRRILPGFACLAEADRSKARQNVPQPATPNPPQNTPEIACLALPHLSTFNNRPSLNSPLPRPAVTRRIEPCLPSAPCLAPAGLTEPMHAQPALPLPNQNKTSRPDRFMPSQCQFISRPVLSELAPTNRIMPALRLSCLIITAPRPTQDHLSMPSLFRPRLPCLSPILSELSAIDRFEPKRTTPKQTLFSPALPCLNTSLLILSCLAHPRLPCPVMPRTHRTSPNLSPRSVFMPQTTIPA